MNGFVIRPNSYEKLPELLLDQSPGFREAPEYLSLTAREQGIPGVVLGMWGVFFRGVASAAFRDDGSNRECEMLKQLIELIETLCTSGDPEIVNAVQVEVFEHFHKDAGWHRRLASLLGPGARAAYDVATAPDPEVGGKSANNSVLHSPDPGE